MLQQLFSKGDGTEASPYEITNAAELAYLAQSVNKENSYENKCFQLTNDITLNNTNNYENWKQDEPMYNWEPIGEEEREFSGIFDGNGHTISGLYIKSYQKNIGLFGIISTNARIENVILENVYIINTNSVTDYSAIGGIAAVNNGEIHNCICIGKFMGYIDSGYYEGSGSGNNAIGAVVGRNTGIIEDCVNKCGNVEYLITDDKCFWGFGGAGGIAGVTSGDIINCHNESFIVATATDAYWGRLNNIGGIVGEVEGVLYGRKAKILNCYNTGNIRGYIGYTYSTSHVNSYNMDVGGITGYAQGAVINCYNAGNLEITDVTEDERIELNANIGGIAGGFGWTGNIDGSQVQTGKVYNCYNLGIMKNNSSSTNAYTGGIVGEILANTDWSISSSYWLSSQNGNCVGNENMNNVVGCTKFDESQKLTQEFFGTENLCKALNKWFEESDIDISYLNKCTLWTTNADNNKRFLVLSDETPKLLDSLKIEAMPNKLEYKIGDSLDVTGLVICAIYNNGETERISLQDIVVDEYDFSCAGDKSINVSYKNRKISFKVIVVREEESADSSAIFPTMPGEHPDYSLADKDYEYDSNDNNTANPEGAGDSKPAIVDTPTTQKPVINSKTEQKISSPANTIPSEEKISVTKVKITGKKKMKAGKKITLKATVTPQNATNKAVKWTTSNKKYATVSAKGVVKAKKAGKGKIVKITATAKDGSGKKATIKIRIR